MGATTDDGDSIGASAGVGDGGNCSSLIDAIEIANQAVLSNSVLIMAGHIGQSIAPKVAYHPFENSSRVRLAWRTLLGLNADSLSLPIAIFLEAAVLRHIRLNSDCVPA